MEDKLKTQQTAVEKILFQMKNHEQQAGNHLEKVISDTLTQGKELRKNQKHQARKENHRAEDVLG